MRGIVKNCLILLITFILFFMLAEIAVRIFSPQHGEGAERLARFPPGAFVRDGIFGLKLNPNFKGEVIKDEFTIKLDINSVGLRDKEYGERSGSYRIFCLGDSMTFGYGVEAEDTFAHLLSMDLERSLQRKIESINGGVPGYDVDRYPLVLEHIGLKYHPDLVIVFFTISNDFGAAVKEDVNTRRLHARDSFSVRKVFINIKEYLFRHSHFYAWIKRRLDSFSVLNMALVKSGLRDVGDIYVKEYPPSMEYKVKKARETLQTIKIISQQNGCAMVVVAIPDILQVAEHIKLDARYWDTEKPNKILKDITDGLNVEYLDLLPVFKTAGGEKFYYKKDGHLNKSGHREIARVVADYLVTKNIIKRKDG